MHLFMSQVDTTLAAAVTKTQPEPSPLSTGAIVGIVIGVIAGVTLVLALLYYIYRLKKHKYIIHKKQNSMYRFILDPPDDDSFVERKRGSKIEVNYNYPSYPSNSKKQQQRPKSFSKKACNRHSTKRQTATSRSSFKPLHLSFLSRPVSLTFDDLLEDTRFSKLFSKQSRNSKCASARRNSSRKSTVSLIRTPSQAHCSSLPTRTSSILSYVPSIYTVPALSHASDSDSTDGDDLSVSCSSATPSMLITIDDYNDTFSQQLKEQQQPYLKKEEGENYVLY